MAIDLQNLAQIGIKKVQKIATQTTLPLVKLDMPDDSFGGKILDEAGIDAVMKKFELLIAQAKEHLEAATQKYNSTTLASKNGSGERTAFLEYRKAQRALRELTEKQIKYKENPQLVQEFLTEEKNAPNTSFLFDPFLDWAQKREILAQRPEIMKLHDISSQYPSLENTIKSGRFFDEKLATDKKLYIDLSTPLNSANMARLRKGTIFSLNQVAQETGMSLDEIRRYINAGFFEQIQLIDKTSGELKGIKAIDWDSEITQTGLKRLKQLRDLTPKTSKGVTSLRQQKKSVLVPIDYLSKIGYGTPKEIEEALSNKKVPIRMIESRQGALSAIDIDNPKAADILRYLEANNQNLCSVEEMAKRAKTSPTVIEDALLSGEIVPIKECTGANESKIKINAATKRNLAYIDKKLFERELLQQERKTATSLRSKLAWHFCPNTRLAAKTAFEQNSKALSEIKTKIKDLKMLIANPELKPEEAEEFEAQLSKLLQEEEILTAKTFGKMWDISGTDEYTQGMQRAIEIIEQIQKQGIDSIEDEEVKTIILKYSHQG